MSTMSSRYRALSIASEVAWSRLHTALMRWVIEAKYNPDQPRVPAGSPEGGRWTLGGDALPSSSWRMEEAPETLAQSNRPGFGPLIQELRRSHLGQGRMCVYRFPYGDFVMEGPTVFACPSETHDSVVRNLRRLNDNLPGAGRPSDPRPRGRR